MKLLVTALTLSLMLSACGKDNRKELMKGTLETKPADPSKAEVDMSGSYFRLAKKGYIVEEKNAEGKVVSKEEVNEGDLYFFSILKNGEATTYLIDAEDGTFVTIKETVKYKDNLEATSVFNGSSCSEFDSSKNDIGKETRGTYSITKNGGIQVAHSLSIRLSDEEASKVLEKIEKEYELLDSEEDCKKQASLLKTDFEEDPTVSALKEFLAN